MTKPILSFIAFGAALASTPALAQQPMAEILGQPINVVGADGTTNVVYFEADGTVRMVTPNGSTVPANWAMQGQNLCISKGAASECWAYRPFQPQQPQAMNSSCNGQTTWTAQNTNNAPGSARGERGR